MRTQLDLNGKKALTSVFHNEGPFWDVHHSFEAESSVACIENFGGGGSVRRPEWWPVSERSIRA